MSGRGLGHTGGTLDKLEAIPGFRVELTPEEFLEQVRRIGIAVVAQSPRIDPADKKIYALRDVTGTVPSIPLIVGSIISKKIAGGADAIVLDVKVGSGAFMKTEAEARQLAHELTAVGEALGRRVVCLMSDMDQPLGMAVGNALEVAEAIETLRGQGPEALTELCMAFGARMLVLGERAADETQARGLLAEAIASGSALERFREWVAAQGGDPRVADDPSLLPRSARRSRDPGRRGGLRGPVRCRGRGPLGDGAWAPGGSTWETRSTRAPGWCSRSGSATEWPPGDLLCTMYAADDSLLDAGEERFRRSLHFGSEPVTTLPLFHEL